MEEIDFSEFCNRLEELIVEKYSGDLHLSDFEKQRRGCSLLFTLDDTDKSKLFAGFKIEPIGSTEGEKVLPDEYTIRSPSIGYGIPSPVSEDQSILYTPIFNIIKVKLEAEKNKKGMRFRRSNHREEIALMKENNNRQSIYFFSGFNRYSSFGLIAFLNRVLSYDKH